jgi:ankyrin repeat protein
MDSFQEKLTVRDLKSALRNLPQGSDAYDVAYHNAMERIFAQGKGSSEMAKKILAWILCAHRSLSTPELLHALAVLPGDTEIDEDNILKTEQLLTICAGLVTIDEQSDNVRFIHYTTQEYLQRNQEMWLPHAKIEIARSCIAYLSIDGFAVGPCSSQVDYEHRLREFVFLEYAAIYWGPHLSLLMGTSYVAALNEITTEAKSLLLDDKRLGAASQVLFMSERWQSSERPVIEEGEGFSGSHWIGKFGLLPLLEQWIDKGYELDQFDFGGRTPLSWAAENGHGATVKQLLDTGKVHVDSKDNDGFTPLARASCSGQEAIVNQLLDTGKVDVDSKAKYDQTPLSLAAENGHTAIVKQLLYTGKVDVNSKDKDGCTPLSRAASNGQEAVVKQLLTGRVDADSKDKDGCTPLSRAASNGRGAIVKQLLDTGKVDIDSKDRDGRTPLSRAAENGHSVIVKQLLDTGKVDVDSKDNDCRTPLSWAALSGQEATVKQLLDTKQVDVDSKDNDGRSPISFAAQGGRENTAVLLLKNMTSVAAATESSVKVAKLDSSPIRPDCTPDTLGRTPSMWAALGGKVSCIQSLWPSSLPTSSSTTMDKDSLGLSLIHLFAIGNCSDGISLVLDAGFDVNEPDSQGWTPLHWAAYFGHKEVCEFLVDRAADKGLKDSTDRTAHGVSLFVGAKQLNELLKPHLVQDNLNVLEVAQGFSAAYCDSCQRVSIL